MESVNKWAGASKLACPTLPAPQHDSLETT